MSCGAGGEGRTGRFVENPARLRRREGRRLYALDCAPEARATRLMLEAIRTRFGGLMVPHIRPGVEGDFCCSGAARHAAAGDCALSH
jgi:hypothetical protein